MNASIAAVTTTQKELSPEAREYRKATLALQ